MYSKPSLSSFPKAVNCSLSLEVIFKEIKDELSGCSFIISDSFRLNEKLVKEPFKSSILPSEYIVPAVLDVALVLKIRKYTEKLYKKINCDVYSRVDIILNEKSMGTQRPGNSVGGQNGHASVILKCNGVCF